MNQEPILTVTLNPALDITTWTERVLPHGKLRCSSPRYDAGGGGVNVSRAIEELGGESEAFVALGGAIGDQYAELLAVTATATHFWPLEGETRFSLTVMETETGQQYRFVLPGPLQVVEDGTRLLAELERAIQGHIRFVVASGTLPPGLAEDIYARLIRHCHTRGVRVILDTSGPPLRAAAVERPFLMKLNQFEARDLAGDGADAIPTGEALARTLVDRGVAETVVLTLGDIGTVLATQGQQLLIRPPLVKVVSAVGAGDSFVGALTLCLARGWELADAVAMGVAAAASAVTTEATELCERDSTERYFRQILGDIEQIA
ncbi:1-phosphofructokinase family hexose kinase [Devosia nitrariae]|uniref:Phosphofructokinase n=1 Tax=Devosia nitrariae TaxID=2071872 RepID=A0ABQ5WAC9_9HYPH|nr:1-phosphofructokinase family hexose kinase [Devosia nitrariae]GLQ56596.1 phosphofructokinase [Devosia nitrariae]